MESCVLQNIPWTPSTMLSVSNNSLSKTLHALWCFFLPSNFIYNHTCDISEQRELMSFLQWTCLWQLQTPCWNPLSSTILSLLAVYYPDNKLSCYVSNDGASPLTFFVLLEASKFAKLWVPFCKYGIQTRAPFRYFSSELASSHDNSMGFLQEYKKIKVSAWFLVGTINTGN